MPNWAIDNTAAAAPQPNAAPLPPTSIHNAGHLSHGGPSSPYLQQQGFPQLNQPVRVNQQHQPGPSAVHRPGSFSGSSSGSVVPMQRATVSSPIILSPDTPAIPQMPQHGAIPNSSYQNPPASASTQLGQDPTNRPKSTPLPSNVGGAVVNATMQSGNTSSNGQQTNALAGPSHNGFASYAQLRPNNPPLPGSAPPVHASLPTWPATSSSEDLYLFTIQNGQSVTLKLNSEFKKKTFKFQPKDGPTREVSALDVLRQVAPQSTKSDLEMSLRDFKYLHSLGNRVFSQQNSSNPEQHRHPSNPEQTQNSRNTVQQPPPHTIDHSAQSQPAVPRIGVFPTSNGFPTNPRSTSSPHIQPQTMNSGPPLRTSSAQATTGAVVSPVVQPAAPIAMSRPDVVRIHEQFEREIANAGASIASGWEQIRASTSSVFVNLATTLAAPTTPDAEALAQVQKKLAEETQKTARSHLTILRLTDSESKARAELDEANNRIQAEIDAKAKLELRIAELKSGSQESSRLSTQAHGEAEELRKRLEQQTQSNHRSIADLKTLHAKLMADMKLAHEAEVKSLRAQLVGLITQNKTSSDQEIEAGKLRDLLKQRTVKMAELEKAKNIEIQVINNRHQTTITDLNKTIAQVSKAKDILTQKLKLKEDEIRETNVKHQGEIEVYKTKLAAEAASPTATGVSPAEYASLKNTLERILSRYQEIHTLLDRPPLKDTPAFGPDLQARADHYLEQMAILVKQLPSKPDDSGSAASASASHEALQKLFAMTANLQRLMGGDTVDEPDTRTDREKVDALLKIMKDIGVYAQAKTKASEETAEQVRSLTSELAGVKVDLAQKEKQLEEKLQALDAAQSELKNKEEEFAEVTAYSKGLESSLDEMRAEAATLEARPRLSSGEDEGDTKREVDQLRSERDKLAKVVKGQESEIERLEQDVEAEREKVSTAETSLKEGMNAQFAQQAEAHKLEKDNGDLKAERNKWREEARKAQEQLRMTTKNQVDIKPDVTEIEKTSASTKALQPKPPMPPSAQSQISSPQSERRTLPSSQLSSAPASEPTRKRIAQTPLFLPGNEDDESQSKPSRQPASSQVSETVPRPGPGPAKKRRRVMSEDGSPNIEIVSLPMSRISSGAGPSATGSTVGNTAIAIDRKEASAPTSEGGGTIRPVSREWITKNLGICIQKTSVKGSADLIRCKLCFVNEKKAASAEGRKIDLEATEPLPTNWSRPELIDHLAGHQETLRRLKDKRVREGKEPPSP
ncbi:hypothetical protein IAU59_003094 [Kwoniella sp. CBS 9459]